MSDELKKEDSPEAALPADPEGPSARETTGTVLERHNVLSSLDDIQQKLVEAQQSAEAFKDQLLRKAAEFENYKRRVEGEFAALIRNANEEILFSLIPVVEDFARSLKAGKESDDAEAVRQGVELIYQKFTKVLEQQGLVPFSSLGKPFDVDFHDALLQVPRSDVPSGTVVEEVEKGYMLHDRVLRHAKVVVSTGGPDGPAAGKKPADA
jgi:molecular chaperone GrpE